MMEESAPGQQIPLAFNKYDQIDFELFEVGRNQAVIKYLNNLNFRCMSVLLVVLQDIIPFLLIYFINFYCSLWVRDKPEKVE